jgi:hypothetical protein
MKMKKNEEEWVRKEKEGEGKRRKSSREKEKVKEKEGEGEGRGGEGRKGRSGGVVVVWLCGAKPTKTRGISPLFLLHPLLLPSFKLKPK